MSDVKKKYLSEVPLKEKPKKALKLKLKPIEWNQLSDDLKTIITAGGGGGGGIGLSNNFGDNELLGITQKKLTEAFNAVYTVDEGMLAEHTYKTVILEPNADNNGVCRLTQSMMGSAHTKYIVKYNYDVQENITMPQDSILLIDGGKLYSSTGTKTITGVQNSYDVYDTLLITVIPYDQCVDTDSVTLTRFTENSGGGADIENSWGDDETKALSQAWLTDEHTSVWQEFNRVWSAMSSGGSEVTLSVSPSNIFVREQTSITIDASIDASPSLITVGRLKKNGNIIAGATLSGNSIHYVDNLNVTSSGNTTYTAEFFLSSDTNPKSKSSTVKAVNRIYYGAGTIYTDARNTTSNPKTNPEGSYNVTITSDGQYVFFNVPSTMTINGATLSGFEFPLDSPTTVSIDGTNYKSYRSSNNFRASAGTITIIVY